LITPVAADLAVDLDLEHREMIEQPREDLLPAQHLGAGGRAVLRGLLGGGA
jgi:hypothetical protein